MSANEKKVILHTPDMQGEMNRNYKITQFTDTLIYGTIFPGTRPHYVKYVAYTLKIAHFPHFHNC